MNKNPAYNQEVPCASDGISFSPVKHERRYYSQVKIFFSSGAAQTNGGGSLCMVRNSLVNCATARSVLNANLSVEAILTRLCAALLAIV